MTAAGVTRALVGFEARLRDLGVPVVDRLRPGLTREQVDEVSAEFGVRLSQDAAAFWMWHDGDRERYEDDWRVPGLTPFTVFSGLRSSLMRSALEHRITWTDAFEDPEPWGPEYEVHFRTETSTWHAASSGRPSLTPTASHDVSRPEPQPPIQSTRRRHPRQARSCAPASPRPCRFRPESSQAFGTSLSRPRRSGTRRYAWPR